MATIVGGRATSHTPSIAFAVDTKKGDDPIWAPIFEGFAPVRAWLEQKKPDVLFYVYNDHVTSFFFDHYSNFALGFGEKFVVADEGGGPRPLPAIDGHPALAQHIAVRWFPGHIGVDEKQHIGVFDIIGDLRAEI